MSSAIRVRSGGCVRRGVGFAEAPSPALLYEQFGPSIPEPFDHRGFTLNRIIGQNVLTLEGLFSTPIDVAATFIILFTIYGAVLERGGAGRLAPLPGAARFLAAGLKAAS